MQINNVALLSIKPDFARPILEGSKTFEFRKVRIKKKIDYMLIYASSPIKALVGFAEIESIIEGKPVYLWEVAGTAGGISSKDFDSYFHNKNMGFAIKIKKIYKFDSNIDPYKIIDNFVPPQSFMYIDNKKVEKILKKVGLNEEFNFRWRNSRSGQNKLLQQIS